MILKKVFFTLALLLGLLHLSLDGSENNQSGQAIGKGIECDLVKFKHDTVGYLFKVKKKTDLVIQESGLYEATFNSQVVFNPPIAVEFGIISFNGLLNGKTIAGSSSQVAYNPGSLAFDNEITPDLLTILPAHPDPENCPNECCVDVSFPIDCSISPPCDPAMACACFPPLPELLDGTLQPKFVNKLVNVLDDDFIFKREKKTDCGTDFYKIKRKPFIADLGIVNSSNQPLFTPMFGYSAKHQPPTFPGRTFIVKSREPIQVLWENKLVDPNTDVPLAQLTYLPVDETIHLAMPANPPYPASGIPTVVHLHGGFNEYLSDGYPEAWATPNFAQVGPFFAKKVFDYDNAQDAMMLWYHDHALGFTRLNDAAGLLGAYIIRGETEEKLIKEHKIPSGRYEVPLIIADNMFTADGQLFFPYCDPDENPCEPQPSVLPEFFGDFILVNGKAWPYLDVEPRQYRFRVLNACDSRFLDLRFVPQGSTEPISFFQIGTDQGLINKPVELSDLLIGPSQRADLVIDFSHHKGETLVITNSGNAPFPDGDPVDPLSTGLVMAVRVIEHLDKHHHLTKLPHKLRDEPIARLEPTAPNRQVLLFESTDEFCRIFPLLGTLQLGALEWADPITETPLLGSTEIWEIYNTTEDAHPIHLHSGNFQILDRQYFTGFQDPVTGAIPAIQLLGEPIPPTPAEKQGLFDTVIVPPKSGGPENAIGQRTRIIMNFTLPGNYVWHCHILSHEDHDMMRPLLVVPPASIVPVSRSFLFKALKDDVLQFNVDNPLPFNTAFVNNTSVVVRKVRK